MQFIYRSLRVSPRNLRAVRVRTVSFGRVGNPLVALLLILLLHVVGAARLAPCCKASAPRRVLVVFGRRLVMAAFRASHRRPLTRQSSGTASPPLISALGGFSYFQHRIGNPICVHCNPGRPVLLYAGLVLPPVLEYSMENSGYNLRCKIIAQQHPFLRRVARLDVCVHLIHAAGKCCGVVWFAGHFMSPSVGTPPNNSLNPTPLRVHGEITRSRRRGLAQPVRPQSLSLPAPLLPRTPCPRSRPRQAPRPAGKHGMTSQCAAGR